MTLASAEGLTETQAKTAATLQLISKLEPFTYIIQVIVTILVIAVTVKGFKGSEMNR